MTNRELAFYFPKQYLRHRNMISSVRADFVTPRNKPPTVIWIHGPTGTGKTRYIYDNHDPEDIWVSARDLKYWPNYTNQPVALIDDFRKDFCTFHELLRILDRYPYTVYTFYGHTQLTSDTIYITCPFHPSVVYKTREDTGQLLRRITKIISMPITNATSPSLSSPTPP